MSKVRSDSLLNINRFADVYYLVLSTAENIYTTFFRKNVNLALSYFKPNIIPLFAQPAAPLSKIDRYKSREVE